MGPRDAGSSINVLDVSTMDLLAAAFGGTSWYIPTVLHPEHPIVLVIGPDKAAMLSKALCGTTWEIPRNLGKQRAVRNAEIAARAAKGETSREIALALKLSQRQIRYILRARIEK